jgi:hypothetical protein
MAMKDRINNQYPNSRYAVIINDTNLDDKAWLIAQKTV